MSGYILCQVKKAKEPYFVENISTNIYTIEELCYYLYHNLYLIDETIMNEGLCDWLEKELGLSSLAAKIRTRLGKFSSVEDLLYPVFREINYLSYEQMKELGSRLAKYDQESPLVRKKRKADAMVENGMLFVAISVYQELLQKGEELEEAKEGLTRKIYHNLGCAYSYLFQMENALDCFLKAYEGSGEEKELIAYLLAFRSIRTPIEYESKMAELGAESEVRPKIDQILQQFSRLPEAAVYTQNIDTLIEKMTKEYHRSTGS